MNMIHPIYRIKSVRVVASHSLELLFDDGIRSTVDLLPILEGEIYGPLKDPLFFSQVRLDDEVQTVVWPNGADFDPAVLHDWPLHRDSFIAAAKKWKSTPVSV